MAGSSDRARRRCAALITVVLGGLLLSGCSIKLAYNNADRLIRWSVDDYVDFERPQRDFLSGELARLLYWHRTTQLPRYTGVLRRLEADIALAAGSSLRGDDGAQAQLEAQFRDFLTVALEWAETIQQQGQRTGSQLLVSLTPEQIGELPDKLSRENRKFAKEEAGKTLEENRARWAREVRKGLKRFTGRLSTVQKDYIAGQSLRYEPEFVPWVRYRERWQADLLVLLDRWAQQSIDAPTLVTRFRALADARESYYGDFAPVRESNEALAIETIAGVFTRMTPEQAARYSERFLAIVEDLEELVEEAAPAPPPALTAAECLWVTPTCPGPPINAP
ncbi:MAG: DUF6279 family lipoprotein [Pseudomonadota bacterium]